LAWSGDYFWRKSGGICQDAQIRQGLGGGSQTRGQEAEGSQADPHDIVDGSKPDIQLYHAHGASGYVQDL
jgi:hypothetical protein